MKGSKRNENTGFLKPESIHSPPNSGAAGSDQANLPQKYILLAGHPPWDIARIFHEWSTATADMGILQGVPGFRTLRRTVQVRLGCKTLRLPGGMPIFTVS